MALMTDKETTKKLYDRLTEFSKYGMVMYYLLESGKIEPRDLEGIFCSKDDEKAAFLYMNLIKKVKTSDLKVSEAKYKEENSCEDVQKLNLLYTSKLIDVLSVKQNVGIDKTYINTYHYLLEDNKEGYLLY